MKRVIVEIRRLSPVIKTSLLVFFVISLISVVYLIIGNTQSMKSDDFIKKIFDFTAIMQVANAFFLMRILSKISKKEVNDRHLRKDIFSRLVTLEEDLRLEKKHILDIKKEITDIKKGLTNIKKQKDENI